MNMIIVLLFLIGICFGSFINVLIDRIPNEKSVLYGRSQCDFCKHKLAFYDLFPILSFLFLRGRCRYCHKRLSWQYPIIEAICGFLFVIVYFFEMPGSLLQIIFLAIDVFLVFFGFALAMMDIKYRILSDKLLVPFALAGVLRIILENPNLIISRLEIAFISVIPLLLIFILSKGRGMGFGDVKLIFVLGFILGFPKILIAYYVAFLTGAIVGVILVLGRKKRFHGASIAFGPFLLLAAAIAVIWGDLLWKYAKIFIGF